MTPSETIPLLARLEIAVRADRYLSQCYPRDWEASQAGLPPSYDLRVGDFLIKYTGKVNPKKDCERCGVPHP